MNSQFRSCSDYLLAEAEVAESEPASVQPEPSAADLGLVEGLRAERSRGQFRCTQCGKMRRGDSWLIWVPDSVIKGDPDWSVTEAAKCNAWNGHFSGWCLACAPKKPKVANAEAFESHPGLVSTLRNLIRGRVAHLRRRN